MTSKKVYRSTFKAQVVQEDSVGRKTTDADRVRARHSYQGAARMEWKVIAQRELPTLFERQTSVAALKADHERQMGDLYAERRTLHRDAVLRLTPDDRPVAAGRVLYQSQGGAAAYA
jgi:hypothetical protein